MPQITFRGKTYNSEFEMPQDVRQAYQESKMREASAKTLSDVVDVPANVKDVYERAVGKEEQSNSSQSTKDLPTSEEIYRQSAPQDMKHLPSDESVYRPSPMVVDPGHSTTEPESGMVASRLIYGILVALIVTALIYFAVQLFR